MLTYSIVAYVNKNRIRCNYNTVVVVVVSGMQLYDCVSPYVDIILHKERF